MISSQVTIHRATIILRREMRRFFPRKRTAGTPKIGGLCKCFSFSKRGGIFRFHDNRECKGSIFQPAMLVYQSPKWMFPRIGVGFDSGEHHGSKTPITNWMDDLGFFSPYFWFNHPNGDKSMACSFVPNLNSWVRLQPGRIR